MAEQKWYDVKANAAGIFISATIKAYSPEAASAKLWPLLLRKIEEVKADENLLHTEAETQKR